MAGRAATIADALVTWLNDPSRSWPLTGWTASRSWEPGTELEDASAALLVQVSPDSRSSNELVSRAKRQRDYTLFVDFRQKYATTGAIPSAWLDARAELVEAVDDALADLTLTGQPSGHMVYVAATQIDPLCDRLDLEEFRQFTATIEVTMREIKTR